MKAWMVAVALLLPLPLPVAAQHAAPAAGPGAAAPASRETELRDAMLRVHNGARAEVGAPPLAWDAALAADAQRYAIVLARGGPWQHDPAVMAGTIDEGENLWRGPRGDYTPESMIAGWLAERRFFVNRAFPDVSTTGQWKDVGHYAQMVWKDTRRIGCAIASDADEDFLVCRYSAPGNWDGEQAY